MIKVKLGDVIEIGGQSFKVKYDLASGKHYIDRYVETIFGVQKGELEEFINVLKNQSLSICVDNIAINNEYKVIYTNQKLGYALERLVNIALKELETQNEKAGK